MPLKVKLVSLLVDDQAKAIAFYTEVLGFVKKTEFDVGEHKWLTVVSSDSDYVELSLEPSSGVEASAVYQKAIFEKGIPATAFEVDDIAAEYKRLQARGVVFKSEPKDVGDGTMMAVFEDTVGNCIQMYQPKK